VHSDAPADGRRESLQAAPAPGPNYWDPSDESYLTNTIAHSAAPPIVVGALVLVSFILFFIIRCFCGICGKVCHFTENHVMGHACSTVIAQ
jgi:hypothetical protein